MSEPGATAQGAAEYLRQLSVGAPAARSMLLTILGEYVAGEDRTVYRETLVSALEALGYRTQAARQAISRSVTAGWLTSARVGRRSRMTLTDSTRAMLQTGYPRIYSFGEPWEWDGRWLIVIVRVPEERRDVRDRLRTKLAWAGFGSLRGGVWISPHAEREAEVREIVDERAAAIIAFSGHQLEGIGQPADVAAEAWDLGAVRAQYGAFIRGFEELRPGSPVETFCAQIALVHAWRKFPFVDPDLPPRLLPKGWPREEALRLFRDRHERWHAGAEHFFLSLEPGRDGAA